MASKLCTVEKTVQVSRSYGKNHKSALKDCEKRLSKDPHNAYLRYWKALILFNSGRGGESLDVLHGLFHHQAVLSDLDLVQEVYSLLHLNRAHGGSMSLTAGPEGLNMWATIIKKGPRKAAKDPAMAMFVTACNSNLWEDARFALSSLMKEHRNEPKYLLSYIAACQLSADLLRYVDLSKSKLNSDLAFAFISRAVDQTVVNPSYPAAIFGVHQLRLATQVYIRQGRIKDLLHVLDHGSFGIRSPIVKNDWEFIRLKIETLEAGQAWRELWAYCSDLLRDAFPDSCQPKPSFGGLQSSNDWLVWRNLLRATWELKDDDVTAQTDAYIISYASSSSNRRNAHIARLYNSDHQGRGFLSACTDFFDKNAELPSCFNDLRIFVERLCPEEQKSFQSHTSRHAREKLPQQNPSEGHQHRWLIIELNSLKFDFLLAFSKLEAPDPATLEIFICNSLRLSKMCHAKEYPNADEPAILAAMGLIRLSSISKRDPSAFNKGYLIQAACILHWALNLVPASRQACMWLLRLQMQLGLVSLGLISYSKLNVKEVLHDSISHLIFTRIASVHPFPASTVQALCYDAAVKDPAVRLHNAEVMYRGSVRKISAFQGEILNTLKYDQLSQLQDLKDGFQNSYMRLMGLLEARRMSFARGGADDVSALQELDCLWLQETKDNRDFTVLTDLECTSAPRLETYVSVYWLSLFTTIDKISSLLSSRHPIPHATRRVKFFLDSGQEADIDRSDVTPAELEISHAWARLSPIVNALIEDSEGGHNLVQKMRMLHDWLRETLESYERDSHLKVSCMLPDFTTLERTFLHMEVLRACNSVGDVALSVAKQKTHRLKDKVSTVQVRNILSMVHDIHFQIRRQASDWITRLSEGGMGRLVDQIVDGHIGETLEDVIGMSAVEFYAGLFRESAQESLDGVLDIRIE